MRRGASHVVKTSSIQYRVRHPCCVRRFRTCAASARDAWGRRVEPALRDVPCDRSQRDKSGLQGAATPHAWTAYAVGIAAGAARKRPVVRPSSDARVCIPAAGCRCNPSLSAIDSGTLSDTLIIMGGYDYSGYDNSFWVGAMHGMLTTMTVPVLMWH